MIIIIITAINKSHCTREIMDIVTKVDSKENEPNLLSNRNMKQRLRTNYVIARIGKIQQDSK